MNTDETAVSLLYSQAIEDIRKGKLKPGDKIQEIKEYNSYKKRQVCRCNFI